MKNTSVVEKEKTVVSASGKKIKVKITYPTNIPEHIRRQKFNKMYDILSGENHKKTTDKN